MEHLKIKHDNQIGVVVGTILNYIFDIEAVGSMRPVPSFVVALPDDSFATWPISECQRYASDINKQ